VHGTRRTGHGNSIAGNRGSAAFAPSTNSRLRRAKEVQPPSPRLRRAKEGRGQSLGCWMLDPGYWLKTRNKKGARCKVKTRDGTSEPQRSEIRGQKANAFPSSVAGYCGGRAPAATSLRAVPGSRFSIRGFNTMSPNLVPLEIVIPIPTDSNLIG